MKTKVSATKLELLAAAARGSVYRAETTFTWWQEVGPDHNPHAVTSTAKALLAADWIRLRPADEAGRRRAVLTKAGREQLAAHTAARA